MLDVKQIKMFLLIGNFAYISSINAQWAKGQSNIEAKPEQVMPSTEAATDGITGLRQLNYNGNYLKLDNFQRLDAPIDYGLKYRKPSNFSSSMSYGSLSRFVISCDSEIRMGQCDKEISHYSLVGKNNELLELAMSFNCSEFNWFDIRNKLDASTCESRLNCATNGASRGGSVAGACVPDRTELDLAIPVDEYNQTINHAILRNLSISEDAEKIQKELSLSKKLWNLDSPKSCQAHQKAELSGCSKSNLDDLSKSYEDYLTYVKSSNGELSKIISDDPILKNKNNSVLDSINRIRELNSFKTESIVVEEKRTRNFLDKLFSILTTSGNKSVAEITKMITTDIRDNEDVYFSEYESSITSLYLSNKQENLKHFIEVFKKNQKVKQNDYEKLSSHFEQMIKADFTKIVSDQCEFSDQLNLKAACEVLESKNAKSNRSKQYKFDVNKHKGMFTGNALDFMLDKERAKSAFFIRACENTEMQQTFTRHSSAKRNFNTSTGESDDDLDTDRRRTAITFGPGSAAVESKTSTVTENSGDAEDTMISSQIANAFSPASEIGNDRFDAFGTNFSTGQGSMVPTTEIDSNDKKSNDDANINRAASIDKGRDNYESVQKELENLKGQLAQQQQIQQQKLVEAPKNAQISNEANSTRSINDILETEKLKRKIAELEKEISKPKEIKPASVSGFDDSVWSRPSGTSSRSIASDASNVAGSSVSARSISGDNTSSGTVSNGVSNSGNKALNSLPQPAGPTGGLQNLSLVKYENQSMVVLPQTATTKDVENKILELSGKPFFIQNADGSFTYVVADLDKDGKPQIDEEGKPKYMVKKVASDKVSPVKARGVASLKNVPKVRELKELKDPATRKRELDELLKKTKK